MKKTLKNRLQTLKFHYPKLYFLYVTILKGQKIREVSPKPWIAEGAVQWLGQNLNEGMKVFEYGSGGSTLFISPLAEEVISMEHDPVFSVILKNKIKKDSIRNCRLIFSPPQSGAPEGALYGSTDEKYKNMNFKKYVETINQFPDGYFDFVFVDGRARNSCVATALPKIKNGGYLMLDNSDRPEYKLSRDTLSIYPSNVFANPSAQAAGNHCETTVWHIKK